MKMWFRFSKDMEWKPLGDYDIKRLEVWVREFPEAVYRIANFPPEREGV